MQAVERAEDGHQAHDVGEDGTEGIDAPEDEMSADMERRMSVRYAPEFRARLSQRETLDEVAQRVFR